MSVPVTKVNSMPPALYSAMSLSLASWLEASLQLRGFRLYAGLALAGFIDQKIISVHMHS